MACLGSASEVHGLFPDVSEASQKSTAHYHKPRKLDTASGSDLLARPGGPYGSGFDNPKPEAVPQAAMCPVLVVSDWLMGYKFISAVNSHLAIGSSSTSAPSSLPSLLSIFSCRYHNYQAPKSTIFSSAAREVVTMAQEEKDLNFVDRPGAGEPGEGYSAGPGPSRMQKLVDDNNNIAVEFNHADDARAGPRPWEAGRDGSGFKY
ncbi:unnamed protein product [Cyclocybe aegerita]|uniref:Uncharacterized protein n=1 Tax=Cyclocybe aegerita TaxID=1973307 RepID=A0A8S0WM52_CYCAE|nr:unnamed protein product [Cyclocybe aegerita]